jgi:hypothetical protein
MCYHVVTGGDDMIMRGKEVSSLYELKQNFSIDELIYCFYSGELEIWFRQIGEYDMADKLLTIQRNAYLLVKIYEVLGLNKDMLPSQCAIN